jgi:hypothetical protein
MKVRDSDVLAWVRVQGKVSQVLDAFGLLDLAMLRPVLAWLPFWNLWTVYFFNFQIFFQAAVNRVWLKPGIVNQWMGGHDFIFYTRKKSDRPSLCRLLWFSPLLRGITYKSHMPNLIKITQTIMESSDWNSFMATSKLRLSRVLFFSRNDRTVRYCGYSLHRILSKSDQKYRTCWQNVVLSRL